MIPHPALFDVTSQDLVTYLLCAPAFVACRALWVSIVPDREVSRDSLCSLQGSLNAQSIVSDAACGVWSTLFFCHVVKAGNLHHLIALEQAVGKNLYFVLSTWKYLAMVPQIIV